MSVAETPEPSRFADRELTDVIAELNSRPAEADVATMREGGARRARARAQGPDMASVRGSGGDGPR